MDPILCQFGSFQNDWRSEFGNMLGKRGQITSRSTILLAAATLHSTPSREPPSEMLDSVCTYSNHNLVCNSTNMSAEACDKHDSSTADANPLMAHCSAAILSQNTTGRYVYIWEIYATTATIAGAPAGYTPLVQTFSGEMSSATVGDTIEIQLKESPPLRCPRKFIAPPICNHLPAPGTRIEMPADVYILK